MPDRRALMKSAAALFTAAGMPRAATALGMNDMERLAYLMHRGNGVVENQSFMISAPVDLTELDSVTFRQCSIHALYGAIITKPGARFTMVNSRYTTYGSPPPTFTIRGGGGVIYTD